jgi:hypothetical protein
VFPVRYGPNLYIRRLRVAELGNRIDVCICLCTFLRVRVHRTVGYIMSVVPVPGFEAYISNRDQELDVLTENFVSFSMRMPG